MWFASTSNLNHSGVPLVICQGDAAQTVPLLNAWAGLKVKMSKGKRDKMKRSKVES